MEKLVVSAHQPNFLPYLGFFDKMSKSDIFVIRDEVLFIRKDYHQRNRIRINGIDNHNNPQCKWIKVPVFNQEDYIHNIKINPEFVVKKIPWNMKMIQEIKAAYKGAPHFEKYYPELKEIFLNSENEKLVDLNMKIINFIKNAFKIDTKIIMASDLGLKDDEYSKTDASEDLALICKKLNGEIYLSGDGGKDYLDLRPFKDREIEVKFQNFKHPIYNQRIPGFVPNMSAIDALFCIGKMPSLEE